MAISLEVEEYCEDCPMFEPKVRQYIREDHLLNRHNDTIVYCKNDYACGRVARLMMEKKVGEKMDG